MHEAPVGTTTGAFALRTAREAQRLVGTAIPGIGSPSAEAAVAR